MLLPKNNEVTDIVVFSIRYDNGNIVQGWMVPDPAEQFANPYLAMGNNPVVYVDPDGEFIIPVLIGAAISVVTNGISNSIHDQGFFEGADRAALIGGVSGAVSFGIGGALEGMTGMGKVVLQAYAHAHLGGIMSDLSGGEYISGFASGAVGSLAASASGFAMSGTENDVGKGIGMVAFGAVSGGISAEVAGGDFWDGARNGAISAGLNHVAHSFGQNEDPPEGGVDGWKTFSGIAATAGGITMIAGGVLAAVTPGGQILAIYLISSGAVVTGFGAATTIDGLNGGHREDLGGPAYTIERRIGGDGTVGEIIDMGLGGHPITILNKAILGANILSSGTVRSVFQSSGGNAIHFQNDFVAYPDNTKVDLNLNRYFR